MSRPSPATSPWPGEPAPPELHPPGDPFLFDEGSPTASPADRPGADVPRCLRAYKNESAPPSAASDLSTLPCVSRFIRQ